MAALPSSYADAEVSLRGTFLAFSVLSAAVTAAASDLVVLMIMFGLLGARQAPSPQTQLPFRSKARRRRLCDDYFSRCYLMHAISPL